MKQVGYCLEKNYKGSLKMYRVCNERDGVELKGKRTSEEQEKVKEATIDLKAITHIWHER